MSQALMCALVVILFVAFLLYLRTRDLKATVERLHADNARLRTDNERLRIEALVDRVSRQWDQFHTNKRSA